MIKFKLHIVLLFIFLLLINHSFSRNQRLKLTGKVQDDSLFSKSVNLSIFSEYGGIAYLDGRKVGRIDKKNGLVIKKLSPGSHRILVRVRKYGILTKPEYKLKFKDWEKNVFLEPEKTNSVKVTGLTDISDYIYKKRILYNRIEKLDSTNINIYQKNINFVDKNGNKSYIRFKCELAYKMDFNSGSNDMICNYYLKVDRKVKRGEYKISIPSENEWFEVATIGKVKLQIFLNIESGIACGVKLRRTDI